jgi:hypothetical protein
VLACACVSGPAVTVSCAGSVYVYRYDEPEWTLQYRMIAPDFYSGDRFGASVAMYESEAFIGATYDDDAGTDAGECSCC